MRHEKSCGAVVFTRRGGELRYVIIQGLRGFHGFPKGHVEGTETEEETALREVLEEVGLKACLLEGFRAVEEYTLPHHPDTRKQVVFFLAEFDGQELNIQESELRTAALLPYEEALSLLEYEDNRRVLREAEAFLKNR